MHIVSLIYPHSVLNASLLAFTEKVRNCILLLICFYEQQLPLAQFLTGKMCQVTDLRSVVLIANYSIIVALAICQIFRII